MENKCDLCSKLKQVKIHKQCSHKLCQECMEKNKKCSVCIDENNFCQYMEQLLLTIYVHGI